MRNPAASFLIPARQPTFPTRIRGYAGGDRRREEDGNEANTSSPHIAVSIIVLAVTRLFVVISARDRVRQSRDEHAACHGGERRDLGFFAPGEQGRCTVVSTGV